MYMFLAKRVSLAQFRSTTRFRTSPKVVVAVSAKTTATALVGELPEVAVAAV
jgi:hypothetical protein